MGRREDLERELAEIERQEAESAERIRASSPSTKIIVVDTVSIPASDDETSHRDPVKARADETRASANADIVGAAVKAAAARPKLDFSRSKMVGQFPAWCPVPEDLQPPKYAVSVAVRFQAVETARPDKGDRTAVVWQLSDGDERLAMASAVGDALRLNFELAKRFIRVVDGQHAVDQPGLPGDVNRFWDEVGPKGRTKTLTLYNQLHHLTNAELADFFEKHVAFVVLG